MGQSASKETSTTIAVNVNSTAENMTPPTSLASFGDYNSRPTTSNTAENLISFRARMARPHPIVNSARHLPACTTTTTFNSHGIDSTSGTATRTPTSGFFADNGYLSHTASFRPKLDNDFRAHIAKSNAKAKVSVEANMAYQKACRPRKVHFSNGRTYIPNTNTDYNAKIPQRRVHFSNFYTIIPSTSINNGAEVAPKRKGRFNSVCTVITSTNIKYDAEIPPLRRVRFSNVCTIIPSADVTFDAEIPLQRKVHFSNVCAIIPSTQPNHDAIDNPPYDNTDITEPLPLNEEGQAAQITITTQSNDHDGKFSNPHDHLQQIEAARQQRVETARRHRLENNYRHLRTKSHEWRLTKASICPKKDNKRRHRQERKRRLLWVESLDNLHLHRRFWEDIQEEAILVTVVDSCSS